MFLRAFAYIETSRAHALMEGWASISVHLIWERVLHTILSFTETRELNIDLLCLINFP
jgi:hypothetical protein